MSLGDAPETGTLPPSGRIEPHRPGNSAIPGIDLGGTLGRRPSLEGTTPMPTNRLALPLLISLALAGCGGGGSSSTTSDTTTGNDTTTQTATPQEQFPTGVSVASPLDLTAQANVAQLAPASTRRQVADFFREAGAALAARDWDRAARLAGAVFPLPRAHAVPNKVPEFARQAAILDAILAGTQAAATHIDWFAFYDSPNNANCFGPDIPFSDHNDVGGADPQRNGTLPTGDLGMWTATSTEEIDNAFGTRPCSVAQLTRLMSPRKKAAVQSLVLTAAMRRIVAANRLDMPASGATLDITARLQALLPAQDHVTLSAATISRSANTLTYRVRGTDATVNQTVEVLVTHRPGGSAAQHGGTMLVTVLGRSNQPGYGCEDAQTNGVYNVAWMHSVRYVREGNDVHFSGRAGRYCGHGDAAQANLGATIAALTDSGELDPAVVRGANARGWKADFHRFAGSMDRQTHAGNFAYAWQAGSGDSHSRMFAVTAGYNTVTEARTAKAYYGYAAPIGTTTGSLLGMICNWAGPGNSHVPQDKFQYQAVSLVSAADEWAIDTSKIAYAPTNNCNSTGAMNFDVADDGLTVGDGANVTNDLDSKGGSASVAAELAARGYVVPTHF